MPSPVFGSMAAVLSSALFISVNGPQNVLSGIQNSLSFVKDTLFTHHQHQPSPSLFTGTTTTTSTEQTNSIEDIHFIEPRSFDYARNLPSDPFLPPFEPLIVDKDNQDELLQGNWLVIGTTSWCPFSKRIGPKLLSYLDTYGEQKLRVAHPHIRIAILDIEAHPQLALRLNLRSSPQLQFLSAGKLHLTLSLPEEDLSRMDILGSVLDDDGMWRREHPKAPRRVTKFKLLEFRAVMRAYRFVFVDQLRILDWINEHQTQTFSSLGGVLLALLTLKIARLRT